MTNCPCTRGLAFCSHVCAALLHLHKNVSVTDRACSWAVRKVRNKNNEQPILSSDFKAIQVLPSVDAVKRHFTKELAHCHGAGISVIWLASDEPSRLPESETLNVLNPYDIILSDAYREAACKKAFLADILNVDWDTTQRIAEATKDQITSPLWYACRKGRITASKIGEVLKCYSSKKEHPKPSKSLLQSLYRPTDLNKVMSVMWGRDHEQVAIQKFMEEYKTEVTKTGFWFDECGFMGGSPDGIIGTRGIVEVKCPYSLRDSDLNVKLTPSFGYFLYRENERWHHDSSHPYYHQVQAQLYFTRREYCVFIVWTPNSMVVKRVDADPLWPEICLPLLKEFYVNEFVPYVQKQESRAS